jgi:hypothetical protein
MSVSLREAQVTKILGNLLQGDKYDRDNFNSCLASILALFPPQLTEEEVEKILPKKDLFPKDHIQPTCQCPECIAIENRNQAIDDCKTALIGKCGGTSKEEREIIEWCRTQFNLVKFCHDDCDVPDSEHDMFKLADEGSKKLHDYLAQALATPTFSGKVIDKTKSVGCNTCEYEERICITPCTYKKKPTEQKVCTCDVYGNAISQDRCPIHGKPIPVEKKEGTGMKITGRFWSWIEVREDHHDLAEIEISCEDLAKQLSNTDVQDLVEFTIRQRGYQSQEYASEPKPKDRIEELEEGVIYEAHEIANKLNELIRHINKES